MQSINMFYNPHEYTLNFVVVIVEQRPVAGNFERLACGLDPISSFVGVAKWKCFYVRNVSLISFACNTPFFLFSETVVFYFFLFFFSQKSFVVVVNSKHVKC